MHNTRPTLETLWRGTADQPRAERVAAFRTSAALFDYDLIAVELFLDEPAESDDQDDDDE